MWIVCLSHDSHEMSNLFLWKKKYISNCRLLQLWLSFLGLRPWEINIQFIHGKLTEWWTDLTFMNSQDSAYVRICKFWNYLQNNNNNNDDDDSNNRRSRCSISSRSSSCRNSIVHSSSSASSSSSSSSPPLLLLFLHILLLLLVYSDMLCICIFIFFSPRSEYALCIQYHSWKIPERSVRAQM